MALVSEIVPASKDRQTVHKRTRCTYSVFLDRRNERYLQLDTYGSDDREFPDKVSQSIQFDAQGAARLKELIQEAFPSLGGEDT